ASHGRPSIVRAPTSSRVEVPRNRARAHVESRRAAAAPAAEAVDSGSGVGSRLTERARRSVFGGVHLVREGEDFEVAGPDRAEQGDEAAGGGEVAGGERVAGAVELLAAKLGREIGGAAGGLGAGGLVAGQAGEPGELGVEVASLGVAVGGVGGRAGLV